MDLRYELSQSVRVLEACHVLDACDLVAVGTDSGVDVLQVSDTAVVQLTSFHLGARVTALAFSSSTVSPSVSDQPSLELVAAPPRSHLEWVAGWKKRQRPNPAGSHRPEFGTPCRGR